MSLTKEFIPIESLNGSYGINQNGEVRKLIISQGSNGKIVKAYVETNGYKRIGLSIGGKRKLYYVHRLLAEVFIDNPEGKKCVNHIDGNKLNNSLDNLEWVTYSENTQHAVNTGLHQIGESCYNYKHGKYSRHKGEKDV